MGDPCLSTRILEQQHGLLKSLSWSTLPVFETLHYQSPYFTVQLFKSKPVAHHWQATAFIIYIYIY